MVAHCKNPNEACKILVDKSTKLWHEEEDLRDDSVCPTSARVAQFLLARIVAALSWRWGRCRHPYAVRRRRSSLFPLPNRALQSLRWSRFCPSDCHEQVERVTRGRTLRCCLQLFRRLCSLLTRQSVAFRNYRAQSLAALPAALRGRPCDDHRSSHAAAQWGAGQCASPATGPWHRTFVGGWHCAGTAIMGLPITQPIPSRPGVARMGQARARCPRRDCEKAQKPAEAPARGRVDGRGHLAHRW